jgi:phage terminase small subunit
MPDLTPEKPPSHLRSAGRRLWAALTAEFEFSPAETALLVVACEQIDLQDQARKLIRRDGLTVENARTGAVKENPACATQRQCARLLGSLLRQLDVPTGDETPSYTPRSGKRGLSGRRAASGSGRRALR